MGRNVVYIFVSCLFTIFRDGQSRAGVYCAANACIEQVIQHGEIDVFQAVKTVRRHRPQLVENIVSIFFTRKKNMFLITIFQFPIRYRYFQLNLFLLYLQTEYKYCYDLVLHYVLHYLNKDTEVENEESALK